MELEIDEFNLLHFITVEMKKALFVFECFILLLYGCTPCSTSSTGGFANEVWGKWKLTRIVSPSKTQTNLNYSEILKIGNKTSNGVSVVSDSVLRDNKLIWVGEWMGIPAQECQKAAISITYTDRLQRKYWLQNKGTSLEATGYVDGIGGPTDTVRYFYVALP